MNFCQKGERMDRKKIICQFLVQKLDLMEGDIRLLSHSLCCSWLIMNCCWTPPMPTSKEAESDDRWFPSPISQVIQWSSGMCRASKFSSLFCWLEQNSHSEKGDRVSVHDKCILILKSNHYCNTFQLSCGKQIILRSDLFVYQCG